MKEKKILAINKSRGGITRQFTQAVWKHISKNPNCPWVEVGTKQPIPIPEEVEVTKKKVVEVAEDDLSYKELRAALKEWGVEIPKYAKKVELKKLYDDNKK